jgi:hypothetical protein
VSISPLKKAVSQPIPHPRNDEAADDEAPLSFHFKEITPEDWRANETPLADLYQRRIVSGEYVRQRLKIPEEAGGGTMAQTPRQAPKPLDVIKSEVPERWRLKQTKRGVIAERIG